MTNTNNSGPGSLRQAITDANADTTGDPATILFQVGTSDPNRIDVDAHLPGGDAAPDVWVINPASALPALNNPSAGTIIDARTQTSFAGDLNPFGPEIVLDMIANPLSPALALSSGGNQVHGLNIQGYGTTPGVRVNGDGNWLSGNFIGTDATGRQPRVVAGSTGVLLEAGASDNLIGSDLDGLNDAAERNLISGNGSVGVFLTGLGTDRNTIAGNFVGTDATGTAALGNGQIGIALIDGPASNIVEQNVISGNGLNGVDVQGAQTAGNTIAGNRIGTNAAGVAAIPNRQLGVAIAQGADANTVRQNLVSGNGLHGLAILGPGTDGNTIIDNRIGTDASGMAAVPNSQAGIVVQSGPRSNIIQQNLASGNQLDGVHLSGSGTDDNTVTGNYVGTDASGMAALPNGRTGIALQSGPESNVVEQNVISGNELHGVFLAGSGTDHNTISRNRVGTSVDGLTAIPNVWQGIFLTQGTDGNSIDGNLVSGNGAVGVYLTGSNENSITGNLIGTDITGTRALPNGSVVSGGSPGILVEFGASNNQIGTDGDGVNDPQERNVISGNANAGLIIQHLNLGFPQLIPETATAGNVVAGNYIGTDITGTRAIPNAIAGVLLQNGARSNLVGTDGDGLADDAERNVISGNLAQGVGISAPRVEALSIAEAIVLGDLPSTTTTGFVNQADFRDGIAGAAGDWAFDNPIPGGGGDDYVFVATGTLRVHTAGTFTFALRANEGGRLRIDGNRVIEDDVRDGFSSLFDDISLAAGLHTIEWLGFERGGAAAFELSVAVGPGRSGPVTGANGWRVLGDPTPHAEIELDGPLAVTTHYHGRTDLHNVVAGNYIGTDVTGTIALGNSQGVAVDGANNLVGGSSAAERNLIAGNRSHGVWINGTNAADNAVQGNYVGLDFAGVGGLTNSGNGILIENGAQRNRIGTDADGIDDVAERNVISLGSNGIEIRGAGSSGNVVAGNYLGTDVSGLLDRGSTFNGIAISNGATGNVIGGTTAAERNVVAAAGSGSLGSGIGLFGPGTEDNIVQGNYVGTNATGQVALGNAFSGIHVASPNNTIGGPVAGAGNLVSGNSASGVYIDVGAFGTMVQGNLVGTDTSGAIPLPNGANGIVVTSAANQIGGETPEARNIVSGNGASGVVLTGLGATGNLVAGNYIGTDVTGMTSLIPELPATARTGTGAAAVFVATGGRAVVEAELFQSRTIFAGADWRIVPDEAAGVARFFNARGSYLQVLPEAGLFNANVPPFDRGPAVRYRVQIDTPGTYQLFPRFDGFDGGSDSLYAGIMELRDGVGAGQADWYRFGQAADADFATATWVGSGGFETTSASGGDVPAVWTIAHAGIYTIEFLMREDGVALDAFVLQLATLQPPPNVSLGNRFDGIAITAGASNNLVGTDVDGDADAGERNVISGNHLSGVRIVDAGSDQNTVAGNLIGTNAAGTVAIGNFFDGVTIHNGAQANVIGTDGDGSGDGAEGNVISGSVLFSGVAVFDPGTQQNLIAGNLIGTDATGTSPLANGFSGIHLFGGAASNRIGSDGDGMADDLERNLLSGNAVHGVFIDGPGSSHNTVAGNNIGTDITGALDLGNGGAGVQIVGAAGNTIGGDTGAESNAIAFNAEAGVLVTGTTATENTIRLNSIHSNGGIAISLAGGNRLQEAPLLVLAEGGASETRIVGSLQSAAHATFTLDFYVDRLADAAGQGGGQQFIGSIDVNTNGAGSASFEVTLGVTIASGEVLSATATDAAGNTSEFSAVLQPDRTGPTSTVEPLPVRTDSLTFTVSVSGTDPLVSGEISSGVSHYDVFVSVDGGPFTLWQQLPAGNPSADFVALPNHTYGFRSVAADAADNVESKPETVEASIIVDGVGGVEVTGFDVQRGATQRSFIRYLDVSFSTDSQGDLAAIVGSLADDDPSNDRVRLRRFGLDGEGPGERVAIVPSMITIVDGKLQIDFGAQGIGGNRNSSRGDGYYTLEFDLNGDLDDGRETGLHFYRLFGDVNGDRRVYWDDLVSITFAMIWSRSDRERDVNGDGVVNLFDLVFASKQFGRMLDGELELDD